MADSSPEPDTRDSGPTPPTTPAWVKGLLIAVVVLVAVAVLAMLLMGGEHGPGRHSS